MMHNAFPEVVGRTANHCAALLKRRVAPAELAAEFGRFGERLAGTLRPVLAAAGNDPALQVRSLGARTVAAGQLAELCGPLAANSLHGFGKGEQQLLLSIEGRALLEQLDRAFGGTGDVGKELPAQLPLSADLLAQRLERQAMAAVASQLAGVDFHPGERGPHAAQLSPFAAGAELTLLELEISAGRPWRILLAVETEALGTLLPRRPSPRPAARRTAEIDAALFADLPLTASATLVDMSIPLHRLAGLTPGTVLPIMVARNVPLQIAGTMIARGTIGEVDDQVALEITQTFSGKENQ